MTAGVRTNRIRARIVSNGMVAILTVGVLNQVEAWPITSWRLFSGVRTEQAVRTRFLIVRDDGSTDSLRLHGDTIGTTAHQFATLPHLAPTAQRRKIRTWLRTGGVDPDEVAAVRLERVRLGLDPDGGPAAELDRRIVLEIEP